MIKAEKKRKKKDLRVNTTDKMWLIWNCGAMKNEEIEWGNDNMKMWFWVLKMPHKMKAVKGVFFEEPSL
jgi:hypothetical protein